MTEPGEGSTLPPASGDGIPIATRLMYRAGAVGIEAARKLIRRAPRERALAAGASIGRGYARLHGPRTSTARLNLALAYPELSEAERRRLYREVYASFGRMVVETALLGRLSREDLLALTDVEGFENLEAARKSWSGGGAIILTAHFGSFELFGAVMGARGVPLSIVHRVANNPFLNDLIREWRTTYGVEVIARGSAARASLRGLRKGRCIAMPLDQNTRPESGIFTPFFGRAACTRDGPARLAMRTGAPVVPAFMFRIGDTARHRVRILPALDLLPAGNDREATDEAIAENVHRMTEVIEAVVREAPEQWIWSHRRWKSQPPGEPRIYPSKADRPLRRLKRALGMRR